MPTVPEVTNRDAEIALREVDRKFVTHHASNTNHDIRVPGEVAIDLPCKSQRKRPLTRDPEYDRGAP